MANQVTDPALWRSSRTAVYAGTFDVVTWGHLYLIGQGLSIFDKLIVAIGVNPNKKTIFSLEERREMLNACISSETYIDDEGKRAINFEEDEVKRTSTAVFENQYLVDFCRQENAKFYLRGIRNAQDFTFEMNLVEINQEIDKAKFEWRHPKPVWIPTSRQHRHISSSTILSMIASQGWEVTIRDFVPPPVYKKLLEKFNGTDPFLPIEDEEDEE